MRLPRSAFSLILSALPALAAADTGGDECVALLHGLFRTENSMNKMEAGLADAGFRVRNISYDSTEEPVATLAEDAVPRAIDACENAQQIHFVTHSMGGILLRQYLEESEIDKLGRVVMLGPPNQGSEVIDRYRDYPGFEWFSGPAGLQLGTGEASVPRSLGPVTFDLGVIAGNRSINPILSITLPDADDGKVSVESTRVEGMNDHLEMPVNHVFMMRSKEVIRQVVHYLENGNFAREQLSTNGEAGR
jgi:hypothetical protein